jgi:hypothetical protein
MYCLDELRLQRFNTSQGVDEISVLDTALQKGTFVYIFRRYENMFLSNYNASCLL